MIRTLMFSVLFLSVLNQAAWAARVIRTNADLSPPGKAAFDAAQAPDEVEVPIEAFAAGAGGALAALGGQNLVLRAKKKKGGN